MTTPAVTGTTTSTPPATATPHISEVRSHLLATLAALRDPTHPMDPDRARAMATVAGVLVDTAKVEVEFIRATGQDSSQFLAPPPEATTPQLPAPTQDGPPNGITSITRHRLR